MRTGRERLVDSSGGWVLKRPFKRGGEGKVGIGDDEVGLQNSRLQNLKLGNF